MGSDEAVQRVIGIEGFILCLARAVASHVLIGHVAVGVILIKYASGFWRVSRWDGCRLPPAGGQVCRRCNTPPSRWGSASP